MLKLTTCLPVNTHQACFLNYFLFCFLFLQHVAAAGCPISSQTHKKKNPFVLVIHSLCDELDDLQLSQEDFKDCTVCDSLKG